MKKASKLLTVLFLVLFTLSCEDEHVVLQEEEQLAGPMGQEVETNLGFDLFLLDPSDVSTVTEKIDPTAKNKLGGLMSKNGTAPISIDTKNILGVRDSVGNLTYSLRLYWHKGPENSIFNLVINKRRDGVKNPPFIMEYEMDRNGVEKKAVSIRSTVSLMAPAPRRRVETKTQSPWFPVASLMM